MSDKSAQPIAQHQDCQPGLKSSLSTAQEQEPLDGLAVYPLK